MCNFMYDGVLRLELSNGSTIVVLVDNIAIVSVARTVKKIEEKTNIAILKVGTNGQRSREDGSDRWRHKNRI